jgi:hypothetical protein
VSNVPSPLARFANELDARTVISPLLSLHDTSWSHPWIFCYDLRGRRALELRLLFRLPNIFNQEFNLVGLNARIYSPKTVPWVSALSAPSCPHGIHPPASLSLAPRLDNLQVTSFGLTHPLHWGPRPWAQFHKVSISPDSRASRPNELKPNASVVCS